MQRYKSFDVFKFHTILGFVKGTEDEKEILCKILKSGI